MTMTPDPQQHRVRIPALASAVRWLPTVLLAIVLLSVLYVLQITVARGYQGAFQSLELFLRAGFEWSAWAILLPGMLWLANRFPVGPGRPRLHLPILLAGGALVMPLWALLVAAPVSALALPRWGWRGPANIVDTATSAFLQRGAYLAIVYGLVVGLATARRLAEERQAAAVRTEELRRELAAGDLAAFANMIGSEQLVGRLEGVARAMDSSAEAAEAETLALAEDLHAALVRSRDILTN